MFRRLSARVLAALLVASMLVLAGGIVVFAVEGGTGPADALSPTGEWMPLAAGQQEWFAFKSDSSTSPVLIRMGVSPSGSANFSVWTPENVRDWAAGNKPDPVGRGAKNDLLGGDLVWTGHPGAARNLLCRGRSGRSGSWELQARYQWQRRELPTGRSRSNCRGCACGEAGGGCCGEAGGCCARGEAGGCWRARGRDDQDRRRPGRRADPIRRVGAIGCWPEGVVCAPTGRRRLGDPGSNGRRAEELRFFQDPDA